MVLFLFAYANVCILLVLFMLQLSHHSAAQSITSLTMWSMLAAIKTGASQKLLRWILCSSCELTCLHHCELIRAATSEGGYNQYQSTRQSCTTRPTHNSPHAPYKRASWAPAGSLVPVQVHPSSISTKEKIFGTPFVLYEASNGLSDHWSVSVMFRNYMVLYGFYH